MKLYYHGSVKQGKVNLPKIMKDEIVKFFDGKSIRITVERNRAKRSGSQNAYYWSVILPYVLDGFIDVGNEIQRTGESLQLMHDLLKEKFLDNGIAIADRHGQVYSTKSTTTVLTKDEMTEYISNIKAWAKEYLNIDIPQAGEQTELI